MKKSNCPNYSDALGKQISLDENGRVLCIQKTDTIVSLADQWIYDSVRDMYAWQGQHEEQFMAKLDWDKTRDLYNSEEIAPRRDKVSDKWGTRTSSEKIEEARARAKERGRQVSVPQALPKQPPTRPEWMKNPKLLPKRPPTRGDS